MAKTEPKTINFDLSKAVNFILDENRSVAIRAVRLFELQVAIAAGLKPENSGIKGKNLRAGSVSVPFQLLASANIIASVKLLEHIEIQLKIQHKFKYRTDFLFDDRDARGIFRRVLLSPRGLKKLRYSLRPKQFDIAIQKLVRARQRIAPLYDYSVRFTADPQFPKTKGGVTNAIKMLCRVKKDPGHSIVHQYYDNIFCASDAKEYKKGRDCVAGFCWLEYFYDPYFRLQRTRSRHFATNLLAQAADTEGLRRYVAEYNAVRARLGAQGYHSIELELGSPVPTVEVPFRPLPDDIRRLKPSLD